MDLVRNIINQSENRREHVPAIETRQEEMWLQFCIATATLELSFDATILRH